MLRRTIRMATTKIHPIKTKVNDAINYILNKDKTLDTTLVSTYGCDKETAITDFNLVLNNTKATNRSVAAQHLIQSFKPGEIDIDTAHEIGVRLADNFLKGRHQYVLATHIDKEHIHNHIIINQVSFVDFKSFKSKRENVYTIRELNDELCAEYGLSVIRGTNKNKERIDPKHSRGQYKNSFRSQLKSDIDYAIQYALNYEDFIKIIHEDYTVNMSGKYTTFKHKTNGQVRPIRMERLGASYTKNMIDFRINNEFMNIKNHAFKPLKKNWVKEIIDLTSDEKFTTEPGLRYWAVRQNNQAIIETINRMNQLGCGSYNQLKIYVEQLETLYSNDEKEIHEINVEINSLKALLIRTESVRENLNLYLHAEQLYGEEKQKFIEKHNIEEHTLEAFADLKDELLKEGYPIETVNDLSQLTVKINELLERKRAETKELIGDQRKEISFINEMKFLANNYDKFIGKVPQYDLNKYRHNQRNI